MHVWRSLQCTCCFFFFFNVTPTTEIYTLSLHDALPILAERVARGELEPEAIDEQVFEAALYTADMPDPDLLIRTAGELRLSNYLLWQLSYAELYVTVVCWPDMAHEHLYEAVRSYAQRTRRFGGLKTDESAAQTGGDVAP